jgi:hypothetical protein
MPRYVLLRVLDLIEPLPQTGRMQFTKPT